jgi:hypothetical protein
VARHPSKHIQAAIEYAEARGWTFTKSGPRAHVYGMLLCPYRKRDGHRQAVFSTPRAPQNHARRIMRAVDRCPHSIDPS